MEFVKNSTTYNKFLEFGYDLVITLNFHMFVKETKVYGILRAESVLKAQLRTALMQLQQNISSNAQFFLPQRPDFYFCVTLLKITDLFKLALGSSLETFQNVHNIMKHLNMLYIDTSLTIFGRFIILNV